MYVKRCVNCMKEIEGAECPYCGFCEDREKQDANVLKWNTILHGRYLVGKVLGQGGFGITYVGYDLVLNIKVAIKEYFPMGHVSRNMEYSNQLQWNTSQASQIQWKVGCENFLKEAQKMAKIDSIAEIVRVRDTFFENNTAYIVMDFVEGQTLKAWLKAHGLMNLPDCLKLLEPLMEGLARVHEQGMIHRDISPDNIMILPDGKVRLLDFGAAKDTTVNQNGASQLVTKRGFSPTEQYLEDGNIGSWTDVYALSATIYYAVTGKLVPESVGRAINDNLRMEPDPSKGLTAEVIAVFRDGLAVSEKDRIQTMTELLDRFRKAVYGSGQGQPYQKSKSRQSQIHQEQSKKKPQAVVGKFVKAITVGLAVIGGLFIALVIWAIKDTAETNPEGESVRTAEETSAETTAGFVGTEDSAEAVTLQDYLQTDAWSGLTYTNAWLNLKMGFPEGSVIAAEEDVREAVGEGQEVLINNGNFTEEQLKQAEQTTIYDFIVTLPDEISSFIMLYERTDATAEEYLDVLGRQLEAMEDMDYKCGEIQKAVLGEESFQLLPVSGWDSAIMQRYYSKEKDGYVACMIVTYLSEDPSVVEEILAGITGVQADGTKENFSENVRYFTEGSQVAMPDSLLDDIVLREEGGTVEKPNFRYYLVGDGKINAYTRYIGALEEMGLSIYKISESQHEIKGADGTAFQTEYVPDTEFTVTYERKPEVWKESGRTYYGFRVNGKMEGIGRIETDSDYIGEVKNGLMEGVGSWDYKSFGVRYEGEYHLNQWDGFGTYYYDDGSYYKGQWENGDKNGIGKYQSSGAAKFLGEWRDGKRTGLGIDVYENGDYYYGELKDGKRDGLGVYLYTSGERTRGIWSEDEYQGEADSSSLNDVVANVNAMRSDWDNLLAREGAETEGKLKTVLEEYEQLKETYTDIFPQYY